jgi:inhibitor of cysteine peptidase
MNTEALSGLLHPWVETGVEHDRFSDHTLPQMKGLILALVFLCGTTVSRGQEPTPRPASSPEASPTPTEAETSNAPKMDAAVDLTESAPAENMEIPAPADEPDPEKTEELKEPLPDEEPAAPAPPVSGKVEVTAAEAGKVVRAAVGNLIVIALQSNPSTGYNWELRDFDYGVADFYKSETIAPEGGNVLFGAPTQTLVTLQAVKPGTQEIKLAYRRLWEPPDQVAETFQFFLQVDGAEAPPAQASSTSAPSPGASPAP